MIRSLSLVAALAVALPAQAADKVRFQLSWRPQAEHGGYYQGVAAGIYAKYGLDVTVLPGGPQVPTQQILLAGNTEFAMGSNSFNAFNYVKQNIPVTVVAAVFQKNPAVVMAHPGVGHDRIESLKGKPVFVSAIARTTWWSFLRVKFGFTDDQMKPYTFNLAPFLTDKNAAQQGFVTNEPYQAEMAGVKPNVFLLSDYGYSDYAYTIEARNETIEKNPDLVQRFVDASIEGWVAYLNGDNAAANQLILAANPDMKIDIIQNSIRVMKERQMIDGGDAARLGVGAMTDERWKAFFDFTVEAGLYPADLDVKRGYSLKFVNKRIGLDAKRS